MNRLPDKSARVRATRRDKESALYQRDDLLKRIHEMIQTRRLIRRGESILVAVSGGLDSMVLLHILHKLAPANKWRLSVAHLNHTLRGRSSDADERLVRSVCQKLALTVFVERADVRQLAKKQKLSIELAARHLRHEFLARVAAKNRISTIALAHHADDQVELFFIRLLRGTGGDGLAGMKWRNPSPVAPKIEIVRPLLAEPKSALGEFAAANKIKFREDATNDSLDILRNRIRHELLPLLRRNYQSALSKVTLRLMEIVGEEADLARQMAEDWIANARKSRRARRNQPFSKLPVAVQRQCLRIQSLNEGIASDFELIEKLRLEPNVNFTVHRPASSTRFISRDNDGFVHRQALEPANFNNESSQLSLRGSVGRTTFDGVTISWQNQVKMGMNLPKRRSGTEYFDAELVGSKVTLRHWHKGDRFHPIGMPSPVKLQDLFVNQKVPQALRHKLILAEAENGDIFWVEGIRISERFQLTSATKHRLQWQSSRD